MLHSHKFDVRISFTQSFACAVIAGFTSKTLTAPLDVIKIRSQVGTWETHTSSGYFQSISRLYKSEGLHAFWKGNFLGCLRIIPYSVIQVLAFQRVKLQFSDRFGRLTPWTAALAGASGGLVSTVVMYPSDTVKTRLIVQHACPKVAHYNGITDAMITIYKDEGLRGFYRGVSTSLLGALPFSGAMFLAYELLDHLWEHHVHVDSPAARGLINGCLAGSFAQTLTFPLDTIRKKMQAYSPALWDRGNVDVPSRKLAEATLATIQKYGLGGLWRGCLVNNLKIAPYAGLMFLTYETCKNFFTYHNGYTDCPITGLPRPGIDQSLRPEDYSHMSDEDIY